MFHLICSPVAKLRNQMPSWVRNPRSSISREEPQALEAVEHRVRVDHRARGCRHGRLALEHGDADARACEAEGVEQADRPAPDDDDVLAHRGGDYDDGMTYSCPL